MPLRRRHNFPSGDMISEEMCAAFSENLCRKRVVAAGTLKKMGQEKLRAIRC